MTTSTVPSPVPASRATEPSWGTLWGGLWPERQPAGRPRTVVTAVAVGVLGAVVLPYRSLGLGTFVVLLAAAGTVVALRRTDRSRYFWMSLALVLPLLAMVVVRDAEWIAVLCVLAAVGLGVSAVVDARSAAGLAGASLALPLASLRGMPWLVRSLRGSGKPTSWWVGLRTFVVSAVVVAVFGALFASADRLFASWVDALVPDLTLGTSVLRGFVVLVVAGLTLAASYVALNPPDVERLAPPPGRPVRRAFEWLTPLGLLLVVYLGFVAAQLTVMFGGHAYLRRTTGLTYAEYVHQGFGQLTLATLLTLAVVATAARKAPRTTPRDRVVLRGVLGVLCLLTLVVVASALFRMHVYEEAYGFTRLRVLVSAFEAWLGLVVVLVLVAGVRLRGAWVPRAALLTGAATLLALGLANPDGYVAERNVERYLETGKADWHYLADLSADAVPALRSLPPDAQTCALASSGATADDWLEWNLGRARAGDTVPAAGAGCPTG